jgi:hypothetical protein
MKTCENQVKTGKKKKICWAKTKVYFSSNKKKRNNIFGETGLKPKTKTK